MVSDRNGGWENSGSPDDEVIVILTNSLPESYRPLVVHLDSMEEKDRTISNVITRLIGEERRQEGEKDREKDREEEVLALVAARRRRDCSEITCFGCGEKGHFRFECPKAKEQGEGPAPTDEQRKPPSGRLY